MPSKYVVRNFRKNAFYHIFNQGVEKREIFLDEEDYRLFQRYLFTYLRPIEEVLEMDPDIPLRLTSKSLSEELGLIAYCLMPNHFHLLVRQKTENAVPKLLKQLTNAYTLHFNERYSRVGSLMQGRYKAVEVADEELLIHLARHIHLNPLAAVIVKTPEAHRWSSYPDYLGLKADIPAEKDKILSYFPSVGAFKGFHEDQADYEKNLGKIGHLSID